MKKLILTLAILASVIATIQAQDSLYVYRTGGVIESKAISTIDSITFSSKQDSMYIYQTGGTVAAYVKAYVDSISFTRVKIAQSTTTDAGVVINGVRWATRNVNTPGTFTTNNYGFGYFYQWDSNVGWPSTGSVGSITATDGTTTWNSSWVGDNTTISSRAWTSSKDPSPKGWRIPTFVETDSLVNSKNVSSTWTTENGVYGEKFTDKTTGSTLFLPASGCLSFDDGTLITVGSYGSYWSSSTSYFDIAYYFRFNSSDTYCSIGTRSFGFCVRPVVE